VSNPLLDQFLAEAADLLEHVDAGLLRLEQDPTDVELINEVFRAAHTLKGSSGLFDLPELGRLTHAAEDLLDAVRSGRVELGAPVIDALFAGFDQVRVWMSEVEQTEVLPADAAVTGQALAVRLRALLGAGAAGSGSAPGSAAGGVLAGLPHPRPPVDDAPDWLLAVPEPVLRELETWLNTTGSTIRAVRYRPDGGCFFRGEDPLHLIRQVPAIQHLEIGSPRPLPPITELEEFDCLLEFILLTRGEPRELAHVFRYVPELVLVTEISGPALSRLLARPPADEVPPAARPPIGSDAGIVYELLQAQEALLLAAVPGEGWPARVRSAAASAALAATLAGIDPDSGAGYLRTALDTGDLTTLLAWIRGLQSRCGVPPVTVPDQGWYPPEGPAEVEDVAAVAGPARDDVHPPAGSRVLKVEQVKIDRLMELASELVVAKNSLPFVAAAAAETGQRVLAGRIKDEYAVISRVSEELQQAVMDVRMLAVSVAFARMPRLVRDLSRRLGKSVRLVQEGEDAAADKDVIEGLGEPLVHLVRNCLDHGIEPPAEREAAGKPPEATLALRAIPEGDAVVIEITDDGRGIDPDAIRRKALERGLIDAEALAAMVDVDAIQLVFEPGFSTAAEVSDVSGRGVGLDAVRTSIADLGGTVVLDSRPGAGTTVRLRLPLTMAVSRVLLLVAGGQRFGMPVDDVLETVSMPRAQVQQVAGRPVLALRQDVVPLAWLDALLGLAGPDPGPGRPDGADPGAATTLNVLIVRTGTGPLGLVVDRFQQDTDVILKPLEGLLGSTPGYCGTALLGDGMVLLVLDVKELNDRATAAR